MIVLSFGFEIADVFVKRSSEGRFSETNDVIVPETRHVNSLSYIKKIESLTQ